MPRMLFLTAQFMHIYFKRCIKWGSFNQRKYSTCVHIFSISLQSCDFLPNVVQSSEWIYSLIECLIGIFFLTFTLQRFRAECTSFPCHTSSLEYFIARFMSTFARTGRSRLEDLFPAYQAGMVKGMFLLGPQRMVNSNKTMQVRFSMWGFRYTWSCLSLGWRVSAGDICCSSFRLPYIACHSARTKLLVPLPSFCLHLLSIDRAPRRRSGRARRNNELQCPLVTSLQMLIKILKTIHFYRRCVALAARGEGG